MYCRWGDERRCDKRRNEAKENGLNTPTEKKKREVRDMVGRSALNEGETYTVLKLIHYNSAKPGNASRKKRYYRLETVSCKIK